jgi:hypothetical protein
MEEREDEPATIGQDPEHGGERTVQIIDVAQPKIADDAVEPLAGEGICSRGIGMQVGDAHRVRHFDLPGDLQQPVRDVDPNNAGAPSRQLAADASLSACKIQHAHAVRFRDQLQERRRSRVTDVLADDAVI